jgi:hypothetical protein
MRGSNTEDEVPVVVVVFSSVVVGPEPPSNYFLE